MSGISSPYVSRSNLIKIGLVIGIALLFTGLGSANWIDVLAGRISEALLSGTAISERWAGISGEVGDFREDSPQSFTSIAIGDDLSGQVLEEEFEGQDTDRHYFAALPYINDDFEQGSITNVTMDDLEPNFLFDSDKFPVFYEGPGYRELSDSPINTFEEESNLTIFEQEYSTVKTTLQNNVPFHVTGYEYEGEVYPLFMIDIDDYSTCFNNDPCDFQFLLPNIQGSSYGFYMLSKVDPIEVNTYINDEESSEFIYPGRPYKLEVETQSVFGGELVERDFTITEQEGNNMFIASVNPDEYKSDASINSRTIDGDRELLIAPTGYQVFEEYNLEIEVLTDLGRVAQREEFTITNDNIEFTDEGPEEIGMGEYETSYVEGVNRLRPIANCLFESAANNEYYEIRVEPNTEEVTLVSGKPYVITVPDNSVDAYSMIEPGSHLVVQPVLTEDFGELTHGDVAGQPYQPGQNLIFTPTIPSSEDDDFTIDALDGQGNLMYEIDINVAQSTCGTVQDGQGTFVGNAQNFQERINAVRPILNSMFVAGT